MPKASKVKTLCEAKKAMKARLAEVHKQDETKTDIYIK